VLDETKNRTIPTEYIFKKSDVSNLASSIVTKMLVIEPNDAYGVYDLVQNTSFGGSLSSEIYSSHPFVRNSKISRIDTRENPNMVYFRD
jgi:hypothetical protein